MLRLITILCLVASVVAQTGNSELDKAFGRHYINIITVPTTSFSWNSDFAENYTISNINCEDIDGDLKGCYECYLCDEEKIQEKRRLKTNIAKLTLINADCKSTKVCCILQRDLTLRAAGTSCGASNPTGYPYSERPRLRAVLPGEYPWRAWVYSKTNHSHPLCAATYIHDTARLLLVPGSCVGDKRPESLLVRFLTHTQETAIVKKILVHDQFDPDTHTNDIALISLESFTNIPKWVKAACTPEIAQPHGSTCVGVSDNENSISFWIPKQSKCNETKKQLPSSLMCAIGPPRDYIHEYGGGLFCLTNNKKRPTYVVYGIALYRSDDTVSFYTDIFKFRDWITDNIPYFRH